MQTHTAVALLLMSSCISGADLTGPVLDGPGGAQLALPAGQTLPKGTRLVASLGTEPRLPRDLMARSISWTIEPYRALAGFELLVSIPISTPGAELYVSDGDGWARVSSTVSQGLLRATVHTSGHLVVASLRPMVWHEVDAPRGGLTSFVFSGARIYASDSAQATLVSVDEGESWTALSAGEARPATGAGSLSKLDPERADSLGVLVRHGALYGHAATSGRLFAILDDGSVRYSDDAGASWTDFSGGLPSDIDPRNTVLASDGVRLFASTGGRTFKARAP
jgi:hypothetical protein